MDIEQRVSALEVQTALHGKELDTLGKTGETLRRALEGVEKTLLQIKWLAYGAAAAIMAKELGLMKLIKLAIPGIE